MMMRSRQSYWVRSRLCLPSCGGVSESTVKTFVTRIYEKLEVRTWLDLLSLAIERGWVDNPTSRV